MKVITKRYLAYAWAFALFALFVFLAVPNCQQIYAAEIPPMLAWPPVEETDEPEEPDYSDLVNERHRKAAIEILERRENYIRKNPNIPEAWKETIRKGLAEEGMPEEMVEISMGRPDSARTYSSRGIRTSMWTYYGIDQFTVRAARGENILPRYRSTSLLVSSGQISSGIVIQFEDGVVIGWSTFR